METEGTTSEQEQGRRAAGSLDRLDAAVRELGVVRPRRDRWVAGVAVGIADRYDVDPVIVRVVFAVLGVVGGIGVPLYLLAWLLLPTDDDASALERALRRHEPGPLLLLLVTVLSVGWPLADRGDGGRTLLYVPVLLGVVWYLRRDRSRTSRREETRVPRTAEPQDAVPARPAAATPPRRARRPRHRPLGVGPTLLALGVVVLLFAGTYLLGAGAPGRRPLVIAEAVALAGAGLILLAVGLTRRRSFVVAALAVALMLALVPQGGPLGVADGTPSDPDWSPGTVAELGDQYAVAGGESVLDLSRLPAQGLAGRHLDLAVGGGRLRVVLPAGASAEVSPAVGLGRIDYVDAGGDRQHYERIGAPGGPLQAGSGASRLAIDAVVGLGDLSIEQESSPAPTARPTVPAPTPARPAPTTGTR